MHEGAIAVACQKGGVGKTSMTANFAAALGHTDWGVLVVNTDSQPNMEGEFGAREHKDWDQGGMLMEALRDDKPLTEPTIKDIKPNVDMVCGGKHLQEIMNDTATLLEDRDRLARVLEPLVFGPRDYDVILIDTPPGAVMMKMVFSAARGLVIPLRHDEESTQALKEMSGWITEAGERNPYLTLLGIVQVAVKRPLTVEARRQAEMLKETFPDSWIETPIRHSEAAIKARRLGVQAVEFIDMARARKFERLDALKDHVEGTAFNSAPETLGSVSSAQGLASDYLTVIQTVMKRLRDLNKDEGYGSDN